MENKKALENQGLLGVAGALRFYGRNAPFFWVIQAEYPIISDLIWGFSNHSKSV